MVVGEDVKGGPQLFQVADALDSLGAGLAPGQRRQQEPGKDADDGDDDEQFHQRERRGCPTMPEECHASVHLANHVPRRFLRIY